MKRKPIVEQVKVGLYLRVSSKKQAEEGYSLDAQERNLRDYCRLMEWQVIGVYRDEGISGKRIDRPALQRLLAAAKEGQVNKIVTLKLDRISRNVKDMLLITEDLEEWGVSLACVKDNIDTSTAAGKLIRTVLCAIAQFESDISSERTYFAKHELALQGKFAGGTIPFGYSYDTQTKEFSINDEQAEIVESIFKDFTSGKTMYQISKELNEEGVLTNRRGKWQQNTVRLILENSFYTGTLEWEGIVNKGSHDAIIPDRLFNKAQRKLCEIGGKDND